MAEIDPTAPIGTFEATVAGVTDLLPQATFPQTLEPGRKGVTLGQIAGFVAELSGRVAIRLAGRERLNENLATVAADAARELVHVGAASYAQAARFPEQTGRNTDGYAAVLWTRFETGLEELAAAVVAWLEDPDDSTPTATARPAWSFPAPAITETTGF